MHRTVPIALRLRCRSKKIWLIFSVNKMPTRKT